MNKNKSNRSTATKSTSTETTSAAIPNNTDPTATTADTTRIGEKRNSDIMTKSQQNKRKQKVQQQPPKNDDHTTTTRTEKAINNPQEENAPRETKQPRIQSLSKSPIFLLDPSRTKHVSPEHVHVCALEDAEAWVSTALVDFLVQKATMFVPDDTTLLATSSTLNIMELYLGMETKESHKGAFANLRERYKKFSSQQYRLLCITCDGSHYFTVSVVFDANFDGVFKSVEIYDSFITHRTKRIHSTSSAGKFLLQLQRFLLTFCFYESPYKSVLQNNQFHILRNGKFKSCPIQTNSSDCSLYALGTFLFALQGDIAIDGDIFNQQDISLLRYKLFEVLTQKETKFKQPPTTYLSRLFIISFFAKLVHHIEKGKSSSLKLLELMEQDE